MLSAFFVSHSFLRVSREYDGMSFGTLIQIYLGRLFRFAPLLFIFTIVSWQIVSSKVLENDLEYPRWVQTEKLYEKCD